MPRVVSLFLPMWPTDRFRRKSGDAAPPPETPLVLIGRDGRRRVVLAADAAARAAGLRIGMPASKAQALVPGLAIHDAEPEADASLDIEPLGVRAALGHQARHSTHQAGVYAGGAGWIVNSAESAHEMSEGLRYDVMVDGVCASGRYATMNPRAARPLTSGEARALANA